MFYCEGASVEHWPLGDDGNPTNRSVCSECRERLWHSNRQVEFVLDRHGRETRSHMLNLSK